MPVYATPAGNPNNCPDPGLPGINEAPEVITPLSPTCFNQHIIIPKTPRDSGTGRAILTRTHAYSIPGAQRACIEHVMRDVNGNPVNIATCLGIETSSSSLSSNSSQSQSQSSSSSQSQSSQSSQSSEAPCSGHAVRFRLGEYLTCGGTEFEVTVVDAAQGVVKVCFEPEDLNCPGIFFGEFAIVELSEDPASDNCRETVIFSNHVYVIIGTNLWQQRVCGPCAAGPLSIAEVRMHLRDSGPEESYLLDNVAFSDEEIIHAMTLPVQYWNEIPPPIGVYYNTGSFPYRYHWLMATSGYLFLTVAEQQRRNNLQYAAGGVQVNDQAKEPNYETAAKRRIDEFKDFVRRMKASINLEMGYGGVGSPYRGGAGYGQPYRSWRHY